jgi:hypothetical protein
LDEVVRRQPAVDALDLFLEVRVNVDETGGKNKAACVDSLRGWRLVKRPDSVDPPVADAYVCRVKRLPRPIRHAGVLNHQIEGALAGCDALAKTEADCGANSEEQILDKYPSSHAPPAAPCDLDSDKALGRTSGPDALSCG